MLEAINMATVTWPVENPLACSISSRTRRSSDFHAGGPAHEDFADRGQAHAPGVALEEGGAQLVFDLLDAAGDRRLGDAEVPSGLAQAAQFGHGQDVTDVAELHATGGLFKFETMVD